MSDAELRECFSKVRHGDKDAFGLVYHELKQPVFTVAWRIVQSRETAEDITQDVFVKLFITPPDASVKNPRAWIFRMARNLAIDTLRKKQGIDLEAVRPASDDCEENALFRLDVESAVGKLPCIERQVLTLHLNGQLKFRVIAQITNLSLPAVYRKYRKALGTLRELLDGGAL